MGKNTPYYLFLDLSLWNVFSDSYSIGPKVSVIFGFSFGQESK